MTISQSSNCPERQRELKDQTNSAQDQEKRTKLYKVGNETLNSIHQKLKDQEYQRITEQIESDRKLRKRLEQAQVFAAVKVIQGSANRKPLTIDMDDGQTAEPIRQVRIVTDHFNKMFCVENTEALPNIEPAAMEVPLSKEEVQATTV